MRQKYVPYVILILAAFFIGIIIVFQYAPAHASRTTSKNQKQTSASQKNVQKSKKKPFKKKLNKGVSQPTTTPYIPPAENNPGNQDMQKALQDMQNAQGKVQRGVAQEQDSNVSSCTDIPKLQPPVDFSRVTSVLYPGQYRSGQYKPHGGFRFDGNNNDDIKVKIPLDASLVSASRYIDFDEVQYLVVFRAACGTMYRFDHILTPASRLQTILDTLPPAKQDDSRTTDFNPPVSFSVGEVIATAVGFAKTKNVSVDFGVYDWRQPNESWKNPEWTKDHQTYEIERYGICWFDSFSADDAKKLRDLPGGDGISGKKSDYC